MTCPTTTPCGPCAAVHSEDPAVYGAGAAPESTEAERLDRMMRAGPAALDSHELLGLLGVRLDACRFPALPAAALSAGSLAAFAPPPCVVRLLIARPRRRGPARRGPARSPGARAGHRRHRPRPRGRRLQRRPRRPRAAGAGRAARPRHDVRYAHGAARICRVGPRSSHLRELAP